MGTVYTIKYLAPPAVPQDAEVRRESEAILARLTREFSTYDPDSELSKLNRAPAGQWLALSPEALLLMRYALELNRLSGGAFDMTVGPLLALWGFGPRMASRERVPSAAEIAGTLKLVGAGQIELREAPPAVRKRNAQVALDLNALVPGYAADRLAEKLEQLGVNDYMVDLGGELRLKGRNERGEPWAIAVESPQPGSGPIATLHLSARAVSSSGGYRNFFELNGKRYSHELDPRSGRPIEHELASVTVIAESALAADGLSTALLVLGPVEGFALAERENLAALFIMRAGEGWTRRSTRAFRAHTDSKR